jgi:hypothetical protein
MRRAILSLIAAVAVGAAALVTAPQPANAVAWWVVPAIVGAGVVGVGAGAIAQEQAHYAYEPLAYEPRGTVYVQPTAGAVYTEPVASCRIVRERINGRWQRVQLCD